MKDIALIVWITQLGFSVVAPMAMFVLLGVWLRNSCGWGVWVIFVGIALGLYSAVQGLRHSLKTMENMAKDKKLEDKQPISFNDHD